MVLKATGVSQGGQYTMGKAQYLEVWYSGNQYKTTESTGMSVSSTVLSIKIQEVTMLRRCSGCTVLKTLFSFHQFASTMARAVHRVQQCRHPHVHRVVPILLARLSETCLAIRGQNPDFFEHQKVQNRCRSPHCHDTTRTKASPPLQVALRRQDPAQARRCRNPTSNTLN